MCSERIVVPVPSRGATFRELVARLPIEGLLTVLLPSVVAVAALAAWQAFVVDAKVSPTVLPPPTVVASQLVDHFQIILQNAIPTTFETLVAFAISVPLGIFFAAVMVYSPLVNKALYPNVVFFQLIPKIALAPLFIVWLGTGLPSRVTFAVFLCFFPILVATAAGLQSLPTDTLRLCRAVKASNWQILLHVRFPASLPYLFSGMKVSVTLAIIGIMVGEFIASQAGLGYLILFASAQQETDLGLACIGVLCLVGLLLYGAVVLCERMVLRWYNSA